MPYDDRRVDRMIRRSASKPLQRAVHPLPETVQRITDRGEGPQLTRAPEQVEVVARDGDDVTFASSKDMRSEIARQVAELVTLSGERGLLREGEAEAGGGGGAEAPAEAGGEAGPFQAWYDALAATGLKDPEIEELMIQRLRGLRMGMLSQAQIRKVGR
jgi:hypothetical protein